MAKRFFLTVFLFLFSVIGSILLPSRAAYGQSMDVTPPKVTSVQIDTTSYIREQDQELTISAQASIDETESGISGVCASFYAEGNGGTIDLRTGSSDQYHPLFSGTYTLSVLLLVNDSAPTGRYHLEDVYVYDEAGNTIRYYSPRILEGTSDT